MSRALYDTPPISINPEVATALGLPAAVFLQQVHYWIVEKKRSPNRYQNSFKDGYFWYYKSTKDLAEEMPFLGSERTIKRMITELKNKGILIVDCHNKISIDKTNWYRIDYHALDLVAQPSGQNDPMEGTKCPNGGDKMTQPIPETTTETTTETTATDPPIVPQGTSEGSKKIPFDVFWQEYPNKQGKARAQKIWKKLSAENQSKALHDVRKRKQSDPQWIKDGGLFIPHGSTYLSKQRYLDEWEAKNNASYSQSNIGPGAASATGKMTATQRAKQHIANGGSIFDQEWSV